MEIDLREGRGGESGLYIIRIFYDCFWLVLENTELKPYLGFSHVEDKISLLAADIMYY